MSWWEYEIMSTIDILDTAQYVVDKDGRQTAVVLDLESWKVLRHLLEELAEDEHLGALMAAVQTDERLDVDTAQEVYQRYLKEREE
jgi:hypothetical protein